MRNGKICPAPNYTFENFYLAVKGLKNIYLICHLATSRFPIAMSTNSHFDYIWHIKYSTHLLTLKRFTSKRLQLNPSKKKVISFGNRANLKKLQTIDLSLHVGADTIVPVEAVQNFGAILDYDQTHH